MFSQKSIITAQEPVLGPFLSNIFYFITSETRIPKFRLKFEFMIMASTSGTNDGLILQVQLI